MKILIIEDSTNLANTLAETLHREHHSVDIAHDGQEGYEYVSSGIYDAAILDLMLPKMNGYELLERLRKEGEVLPILILTAKSQLEDKLEGFRCGADDYLTKPFDTPELLVRLNAITRRGNSHIMLDRLTCGDLSLDLKSCLLSGVSESSIILSGKEFQLMEYLLRNQDQILSKPQIVEKIWGFNSDAEYNNVEVYISFLRKKIAYVKSTTSIRAVRGVGYTLEVPND